MIRQRTGRTRVSDTPERGQMNIEGLKAIGGYWYLASPYSKYPDGIEAAFQEVCRAAAWFVRQGVAIYSPIAETHPIAMHGNIDPLDHGIWLPADKPKMDGACGLIVCKMQSWQDSYGISVEIDEFTRAGKPVRFMEWPQ